MRLPKANPRALEKARMGFYILQAVFIPILIGIIATSLLQLPAAPGATKFFFAIVWLFIPGLIYVGLTPRFERTKPLSNPYAILGINAAFCFLYFIAFIAVAATNNKRIDKGFDERKDPKREDDKGCQYAPSEKECKMNQAAVGFGVVMWLFLVATTAIATYVALYYRVHLITPLEAEETSGNAIQEHTKDAFDQNEPDGYALINEDTHDSHDPRRNDHSQYDDEPAYDTYGRSNYPAGGSGLPAGDYSYTGARV